MTESTNRAKETPWVQWRYLVVASACVVLAALAAALLALPDLPATGAGSATGAANALGAGAAGAGAESCPRWLYLVGTCVLVAVVEELVFRSLLLRAVRRICGPKATIVATAVVFAALHGLPIGIEGDPAAELVAASLTLKFLEALAFGIVLAAMLFRGGTLPLVIALHAVFDIIYFAGPVLIGGDFPATYAATTPAGFASLAAATLILAIPAACALRFPESSFSLGFPEPH